MLDTVVLETTVCSGAGELRFTRGHYLHDAVRRALMGKRALKKTQKN
ncbi:MAG: hypothetical protein ACI8VW_003233 [bacterium]|jgi:hypothetical protein